MARQGRSYAGQPWAGSEQGAYNNLVAQFTTAYWVAGQVFRVDTWAGTFTITTSYGGQEITIPVNLLPADTRASSGLVGFDVWARVMD